MIEKLKHNDQENTVSRMKITMSMLAVASLGLAILSATGCSSRPISAAQAYGAANELDPANKAVATDPRNTMAAHGR